MKTMSKTALLGLSLVCNLCMAQRTPFTGWETGADLNTNNAKTKITRKKYALEDHNNNNSLNLHGGYGLALNNSYVLLFGLDATANNIKSYDKNELTVEFKNPYSFSMAPAMLLSDNALLYVKLSVEVTGIISNKTSKTESIKGYGLATGGRYLLNKNMYLQAEFKGINYDDVSNSVTTTHNSMTQVNLGIGFNF